MFTYKRILVGVVTLLAIAVTFFISFEVSKNRDTAFWLTVSSFVLAEIMLGVSAASFFKADGKALAMQIPLASASVVYFFFAVIVASCCVGEISTSSLLITHVVGLLALVMIFVVTGMAHHNTIEVTEEIKKSVRCKKMLQVQLETCLMENSVLKANGTDLDKKVSALKDAVRFMSDSVPGCENADEKIEMALEKLNSVKTSEEAEAAIDEALTVIKWRQNVVKTLR